MDKNWESIYLSNKMHLVEIVKAVLADNNIPAVVVDKRDSSYVSIGDIEVYVSEENAILARVIIEQNQL
ncbi:MAG TPA: DUF2007 domain-containing protein [Bacteroidia bacterium]|nr:DUF2007 domain-containing protein [Bacteroidia bacterium]HNS13036.1 DUF2007 domain-containing protein [Bacteroidia bacterium]